MQIAAGDSIDFDAIAGSEPPRCITSNGGIRDWKSEQSENDYCYVSDLSDGSHAVILGVDRLFWELLARGFHQIDIGDAFYGADPDWLKKGIEGFE